MILLLKVYLIQATDSVGPGNSPKSALWKFLENNSDFQIDKSIQDKLLITVAPDGYLKKVK